MNYSPELDGLLTEYIEALDSASPQDFGMHTFCGTVACAAGTMALRRENITKRPMQLSDGRADSVQGLAISVVYKVTRYASATFGWAPTFRANAIKVILFGGRRICDHSGQINKLLSPAEQIARQRKTAEWFQRRNRALWAYETRQSLPKRERRAFDISEKALREAA